jgi:HlyD family secretion protein
MRNTRISLDQNVLQTKQQLLEIEFSYQDKKRNYERNKLLFQQKVIPLVEFEKIEDDYNYTASKRLLLLENFKKDSVLKKMQITQIENSSQLIEKNLAMLKENLDNLLIKAPISGQLTALSVEVGENKQKGENIGQIDVLEGFKVRANVDEHYISRLTTGLTAEFTFDNKKHLLEVKKIFPKVVNGQFQVDLEFKGSIPEGLKQGQTLQVKLSLSTTTKALLLKRGGFYQKTGGNWVYLVAGDKAVKIDVKLGRQNPDFYEITDGLKSGDKVIVSSYDVFGEADELLLNDN